MTVARLCGKGSRGSLWQIYKDTCHLHFDRSLKNVMRPFYMRSVWGVVNVVLSYVLTWQLHISLTVYVRGVIILRVDEVRVHRNYCVDGKNSKERALKIRMYVWR